MTRPRRLLHEPHRPGPGELPSAANPFPVELDDHTGRARLGIGAQALTSQLADYFGVEEGVLVTQVEEDSVASTAGLRAGDVITAVDDRDVSDVGELRRRLDRSRPRPSPRCRPAEPRAGRRRWTPAHASAT